MEFATSSDYIFPVINYHFTSIYQASVYDALSKVVSRLMPCQGALERLLDMLVQVRSDIIVYAASTIHGFFAEFEFRQGLPVRFGFKTLLCDRLNPRRRSLARTLHGVHGFALGDGPNIWVRSQLAHTARVRTDNQSQWRGRPGRLYAPHEW